MQKILTRGVRRTQAFRVAPPDVSVAVRSSFEIVLPTSLNRKVRAGDYFRAEQLEGSVVLRPTAAIPPEDAWFYTSEWQKKEGEADDDIRAGRLHGPYASTKAMLKDFGVQS